MIAMLLDVDTGVDDALALLLAARHPDVDLRAVTCVDGNAELEHVVRNTLTVLELAGRPDVPVAAGARRPLVEPPRYARHVHGRDGMADLGLPEPATRPAAEHAVELMRRTILSADQPLTLVPLAPLTNVALLIRTYPDVAARIGRVLLMGGSAGVGNATATAEFNVWHDPEAAAIVFSSGLPITMYGLDVFSEPVVSEPDIDRLLAGDEGARLAGTLLRHQQRRYAPILGDAGAVASVIWPGALTTATLPVHVELAGGARGMTIVDRRTTAADLEHDPGADTPAPVRVATGVDGPALVAGFLAAVLDRADAVRAGG